MTGFLKAAAGGFTTLALLSAGGFAQAQSGSAAETSEDDAVYLGEVIVDGGLTPISADRIGRAVTVITAEEIERRQYRYVADALRQAPGLAVSRTGAPGGLTQIRIRGAEANHVLVLIDGVQVSSPSNGEYDFAGLLAADVERIEVLRGPQSALYGSNATAGVISIHTKRAVEEGVAAGGEVEIGSDDTYAASAYVRAADEQTDFSLSGAFRRAGGYDVANDPTDIADQDRDATLNARFGFQPSDVLRFDGSLRIVSRAGDTDGFSYGAATPEDLVFEEDNQTRTREIFVGFGGTLDSFGGRVQSAVRLEATDIDTENLTDGAVTSDATGRRLRAQAQTTLALDAETLAAANHRVTFAAEAARETYVNNDAALVFDPSQLETQSRVLYGFVGEYQGAFFDALDVQVAVRYDVNDDFDDAFTYSASASYFIEDIGARPHASVGLGVTNPTFFEQYGFIPATFVGNDSLSPETNFEWDFGIEQSFLDGRVLADVTYFRARLEDEIITAYGPAPTYLATAINQTGVSEREGVEVSLSFRPTDALNLSGSYTYLDAKDPDGGIEVRRPRHTIGFAADYAFLDGAARIGVSGRYVIGNYDFDYTAPSYGADRVMLDDYLVVDLTASYAVSDGVTLTARVENATDTDYQEVYGYDAPGVTGYFGVGVRF